MPQQTLGLFALDQNFPERIVRALQDYIPECELVPLREIDQRLVEDIDDWQVLLALYHHDRAWDGFITTDTGMLNQPKELAVLLQTRLTAVFADAAGHDPLRATGLLFTYLPWVAHHTRPDEPQVWVLRAANRPSDEPWRWVERLASRVGRSAADVYEENRFSTYVPHDEGFAIFTQRQV